MWNTSKGQNKKSREWPKYRLWRRFKNGSPRFPVLWLMTSRPSARIAERVAGYFFDSSALAKLYHPEADTANMSQEIDLQAQLQIATEERQRFQDEIQLLKELLTRNGIPLPVPRGLMDVSPLYLPNPSDVATRLA